MVYFKILQRSRQANFLGASSPDSTCQIAMLLATRVCYSKVSLPAGYTFVFSKRKWNTFSRIIFTVGSLNRYVGRYIEGRHLGDSLYIDISVKMCVSR